MDGRGRKFAALNLSRLIRLPVEWYLKRERGNLPHYRRSPAERRLADVRRYLLRNRYAVRFGAALLVLGLLCGLIAIGLPGAVLRFGGDIRSRAMGEAGLKLKTVAVSGLDHLKSSDIRAALNLSAGIGLYDFDVAEARTRLLQIPWIADATLVRLPPDRLQISVRERAPAILWQHGKAFDAVDAQGNVIAGVSPMAYSALFRVVGAGAAQAAPALMEALAKSPVVSRHVESCVFIGGRRWDLHFDNQTVVELPDRDIASALEVLARMMTEQDLLEHDINLVDLRDPSAPRVRINKDLARAKPAGRGA